MEIHQLRYFLSVIRTGSFTRAAESCHVSQPSLSAQIAKLEDEAGGPLLERTRHGAKLTPRGELFKPRAAESLRQLEIARQELAELSGLQRGIVILGCLPATGAAILPPLLKEFAAKHPGIQVLLNEDTSPALAKALRDSEADLAILDEAGFGAGLEAEVLLTEPLLLAVAPFHPLAQASQVSLRDLSGEPLILLKPGHGFRKIVLDAFAKAGVEPRIVYESDGIETVQALVEAGLGLSLVPRMIKKIPGPAYVTLGDPAPSRTLLLARREQSALSPAAEAMRRLAKELFR